MEVPTTDPARKPARVKPLERGAKGGKAKAFYGNLGNPNCRKRCIRPSTSGFLEVPLGFPYSFEKCLGIVYCKI